MLITALVAYMLCKV